MEVILAVTQTCPHCAWLEKTLKKMAVPYCVRYYEDHPEMFKQYNIKKSPTIIVDGKLAFVGMPSINELEKFFSEKKLH